jgi:parallel beta-helix repeat protein
LWFLRKLYEFKKRNVEGWKMNKGACLLFLLLLLVPLAGSANANFFPPPQSLTHVYIRSDGSVDPPSLPILHSGNAYTFTADIANLTVEIQMSSINVDGAGHILNGGGLGQGIVLANLTDVSVSNFVLTNLNEGVNVASCTNITLSGITVLQSETGVSMYASSRSNVVNCNITGNSGDGIILFGGSNSNSLTDNQIIGNGRCGVTLQPPDATANSHIACDDNIIARNYVASNVAYGISLVGASNCRIAYNNISESKQGIQLAGSAAQNNTMLANRIAQCSAYGILITAGSCYNNLTQNTVKDNLIGVEIVLSSNNLFFNNNFINNWKAAEDFVPSNSTSAPVGLYSVNVWSDKTSKQGNFWSDYAGYDDDSDGIGDVPRVIDANNSDLYPLMRPFGIVPDYLLPSPYPIPVVSLIASSSSQTAPTSEPQLASSVPTVAFAMIGTVAIVVFALLLVVRRRKTSGKTV